MGAQSEKATKVSGPIIAANEAGTLTADATAMTGVMRYAVTTASQSIALPAATGNPQKKSTVGTRFLRVAAKGCIVQLAQGQGSAPTLVFDQASAFGAGHVAAGASFFDGQPEHFEIDPRATHIAYIGSAAGFVEFYVSDGPGRV